MSQEAEPTAAEPSRRGGVDWLTVFIILAFLLNVALYLYGRSNDPARAYQGGQQATLEAPPPGGPPGGPGPGAPEAPPGRPGSILGGPAGSGEGPALQTAAPPSEFGSGPPEAEPSGAEPDRPDDQASPGGGRRRFFSTPAGLVALIQLAGATGDLALTAEQKSRLKRSLEGDRSERPGRILTDAQRDWVDANRDRFDPGGESADSLKKRLLEALGR